MLASILLLSFALGDPDPADLEFFEKEVRPILVKRCQSCHGIDKQKGDLRLDSREAALKGGKTGPAVVPGKPDDSVLIEAINYGDLVQMPPKSKLPPEEIATLTKWVERGAAWPVESEKKSAKSKIKPFDLKERAKHWSFQPVRRVDPPKVKDESWPITPIDRFLLATLENKGLSPARPADKRTFIRRATFDVTGLPPTPQEIDTFLDDKSPDAFAKVVDRLLASPAYGERWGRHWLDLMRFAETSGHEFDYDIPDAWRYRDYVIRSFNDDLPYDRFLTEHVAGDLLPNPRRNPADGSNESIQATGFYFLGEGTHSPVDVRDDEILRIDNQIDVLSKTFLGLTVSCARCHDHKFDAIGTKDYYALAGYFKSSRFQHAIIDAPDKISAKVSKLEAIKAELASASGGVKVDDTTLAYLNTAKNALADRGISATSDIVFDDFEGDVYTRWKGEGKAFGNGPIHLPLPIYQGNVAAHGRGLAGSHNGRWDGDFRERDDLTGTLTSEEFTVDRDFIHFLIGGGSHVGKTCVNLVINGKIVESATGHDENPMRPGLFDVRRFRGKKARLQLVDDQKGHWGNISLDHVVFSDIEDPPDSPDRRIFAAAKAAKLDPVRLKRWVEALSETAPIAVAPKDDGSVLFEDFNKSSYENWSVSGDAFGRSPTVADSFRVEANGPVPVAQGMAHSGLVSDRLQGVIRSRTFPIAHKYVHVLTHGFSGRINVVVDSFEKARDPIYGGLFHHVDWAAPRWITLDTTMWIGHRAYLELGDGATLDYGGANTRRVSGDGFLAVDEIRFSDRPAPSVPPSPGLADLDVTLRRRQAGKSGEALEDAALARVLLSKKLVERPGDLAPLMARYREIEATIPPPNFALAAIDGTGENEHVLIRGNGKTPGEEVSRRFLEVIAGADQPAPSSGSGRLELARKMLDPSCPLTARVMVNRIWKGHFGVGLVKTPDDFGIMGESPSHPELLDWLASEFVANGWSTKSMHRMLMLSQSYRMGSELNPDADTIDADNRLLHRMNVRRLEAEAVRDSMLAISGRLDRKMGGPSIPPYLTPLMEGRGRPGSSGPLDGDGRRSVYLNIRRNFLPPMLLAFDFPAPASTMGRRNVSNVPAQALTLLDDPFVIEQAKLWSKALLATPTKTRAERVNRAFSQAFDRDATAQEQAEASKFLDTFGDNQASAWADFCHALFNAKEFLFIP